LTLSHGRPHIYRAFLESIAFGIRQNLEAMADSGAYPRRLVGIGGGVRNPLLVQIVSDITGREQEVHAPTGAAYGDAMMAAVGVGILEEFEGARFDGFHHVEGWVHQRIVTATGPDPLPR
jgi:xylulokinase